MRLVVTEQYSIGSLGSLGSSRPTDTWPPARIGRMSSESPRPQPGSQLPQLWSQTALVPVQPSVELPADDEGFSLKHYLTIVANRRRLVLGIAFAVLLLAALEVFTTTPLFRSTSTVQINPEDTNVLPYEDLSEIQIAGRASDQYIATLAKNLSSRSLARRVSDRLVLTENPNFVEPLRRGIFTDQLRRLKRKLSVRGAAPDESQEAKTRKAIDRLLENLQVRGLGATRLVEVSFLSPSADESALVVNTLIEEFIEQRFEVRYQSASRATDFLEKQLTETKTKLEASEETLVGYAREHDIVSVGEDDTINRQRLEDMSSELTRVENQLNAERANYQAIQDASTTNFPQHLKDASILDLEARISSLRQKLAALSEKHGPMWPEIRQSRQELAELEGQITTEKEQVLASARESYATRLSQRRNLLAEINSQKGRVDTLDDALIQYKMLEREVETNRTMYDGLLQRLKEAGVSASLRANNVEVVDRGEVSRRASEPDKVFALAISSLLGLMLGIVAAVLAERSDQSLKSPDEVAQYLGVPALGAVPDFSNERRRLFGWLGSKKRDGELEVPRVAFGSDTPDSRRAAEEFRAIRTALLLSHPDKALGSILVSSTLDSEGKSTTALNLAIALAKNGSRTLLVDLDLRRAQLTGYFDARGRHGLSAHLAGNTDLSPEVIETPFPNLYFLPAGPPPPNPAELVGAQRMNTAMQLLTGLFDSVIFDTPPALHVSDAYVLARKVDGVVLVTQAGRTRRRLARTIVHRFTLIGANVVGTVLNRVKGNSKGYGEYSPYHTPVAPADLAAAVPPETPQPSELTPPSAEKSA